MSFHGLGYQNAPFQMEPKKDWGLYREAFYSCDGFTYNVTRRDRIPEFENFKLVSGENTPFSYNVINF